MLRASVLQVASPLCSHQKASRKRNQTAVQVHFGVPQTVDRAVPVSSCDRTSVRARIRPVQPVRPLASIATERTGGKNATSHHNHSIRRALRLVAVSEA